MNAGKKGKRFLCAAVLLLMTMLTVGTVVFADDEYNGSYGLIIKKLLADGSPEEAKNQEYEFKITIDYGEGEFKEETFTIKGEGEKQFGFDNVVKITAVELTNHVSVENGEGKWNMTNTRRESQMTVPGRTATVNIGKDEGRITIKKPEDASAVTYFQVTGTDFKEGKKIYESHPLKIEPGKEMILKNLECGKYEIEELKSEGFSVMIGPQTVDVAGGQAGKIYIIGESARLTIMAPGESGDPKTYYFVVKRSGDKYKRDVAVKAGDSYRLEGLPSGTYSIEECYGDGHELTAGAPQIIDLSQSNDLFYTESVRQDDAFAGFRVIVEEDKMTTPYAKGSLDVNVIGESKLVICKPENREDERSYQFSIFEVDEAGYPMDSPMETINLQAGQNSDDVALSSGHYRVMAVDDEDAGFELTYSDSGTVQVSTPLEAAATITFTNFFTQEEGSYRVIHEYYFRNEDGTYDYEGSSLLGAVHGKPLNGKEYTYRDVGLEPVHGGHEYIPMKHGYGMVVEEDGVDGVATPGNATASNERRYALDDQKEKATSSNASFWGRQFHTFGETLKKATSSDAKSYYDDILDEDEILDEDVTVEEKAYPEETGILTVNRGEDANAVHYWYQADEAMDSVVATKNGEQIIILRYYRERETPVSVTGSYHVIHVYYLRDKDGDHWEGASAMKTISVGQLTDDKRKETHTADYVDKEYEPQNFTVDGKKYRYIYDRPAYGRVEKRGSTNELHSEGNAGGAWTYVADANMHEAYATEAGDQIIILRYYRERGTPVPIVGSYNVIHEYYFRKKKENMDAGNVKEVLDDGTMGGSFGGTLVSIDEYVYDFEGKTEMENISAPLGTHYTKDNVKERQLYTPIGGQATQYTYYNVGYGHKTNDGYECVSFKEWAAATTDGEEVMILRYYREEDAPDEPTKPTKPGGGGGGGSGSHPDPTPSPDPTPAPTLEPVPETVAETPGYLVELPDPNAPDSPDRVTVWENGVFLTYRKVWDPEKEEWVYLPESEVPLGNIGLPKTRDERKIILWTLLFVSALGGMCILRSAPMRRKKDNG